MDLLVAIPCSDGCQQCSWLSRPIRYGNRLSARVIFKQKLEPTRSSIADRWSGSDCNTGAAYSDSNRNPSPYFYANRFADQHAFANTYSGAANQYTDSNAHADTHKYPRPGYTNGHT